MDSAQTKANLLILKQFPCIFMGPPRRSSSQWAKISPGFGIESLKAENPK
jgi:hypothetical protein